MVLGDDIASIVAAITGTGAKTASDRAARSDQDLLSLIKAIGATFPVVCRLMAAQDECDGIHEYVRDHAAAAGALLDCNESFAECLRQFPVADDLPFLPDLAQFEWARERALAASAVTVGRIVPIDIDHDDALDLALTLDHSLSLVESPWPVDEIWDADHLADGPRPVVAASAQMTRLLVFRSDPTVTSVRLGEAPMAFVRAIGGGASLRSAIEIALRVDEQFDAIITLRSLLDRGLVTGLMRLESRT
jgi:hypothetical protein